MRGRCGFFGARLALAAMLLLVAPAGGRAALVVHWKLDGDAVDAAGGDHNATLAGNPQFVPARVGSAGLDVDGNGDYASVNYTLPDQGSIALWYNAEPWYDYQTIFDNSVDPNDWEMWIYSSGVLRSRIDGGVGQTSYDLDSLGGPNHWYHIAYTWDRTDGSSSAAKLYVNGELRHTDDIPTWTPPGSTFSIAGGNPGNDKAEGVFDDVRIYDHVLTGGEVAAVWSGPPVVHWKFDGNTLDAAGLDHNATVHGTAAYVPGPPLTSSPALDLDNSRTATTGGNFVSLQHTLPEQGSIAMWYYAEGPWYNYQTLFDNSANADDWEMWIYSNGVLRFRVDAGSGDVDFDLDDLDGPDNWYHIAVTWDKYNTTDAKLYVNGLLRDTDAITNWIEPGSYFYLAGGHPVNRYGTGIWDDVRIYNRVLDATEIYGLAVPEPATLALLGLGALALLRRRRSAR